MSGKSDPSRLPSNGSGSSTWLPAWLRPHPCCSRGRGDSGCKRSCPSSSKALIIRLAARTNVWSRLVLIVPKVTRLRYSRASASESSIPTADILSFAGIHSAPADMAAEPPHTSLFSVTMTFSPSW